MLKKLLLVALIPFVLTGCYETGRGQKIGMVTKVGDGEGLFIKTIEAEIVRGGFNAGSGVSGQAFHFTIQDPVLANKVRDAMNKQQEIKITYRQDLAAPFSSESNATFLVDLEVIDNKPAATLSNNSVVTGVNNKIVELLKIQAQLINEIVSEQQKQIAIQPNK